MAAITTDTPTSTSTSKPSTLLHPDQVTPLDQYQVSITQRMQWIAFGDSITQQGYDKGWLSLLSNYYQRKCDILNRGYSGYNTYHAVLLLQHHIKQGIWNMNKYGQTVYTIFFGANDAVVESESQYCSLSNYSQNLETIITILQKLHQQYDTPKPIIIVIAPPPVDGDTWARDCVRRRKVEYKLTRTNERTGTYAAAAVDVAARHNVSYINTWSEFQSRASNNNYQSYLSDGLHLSKSGNQLLYELIIDVIARQHNSILPTNIPFDGPLWDQSHLFWKDGENQQQPQPHKS